jgi:hypothetical protein
MCWNDILNGNWFIDGVTFHTLKAFNIASDYTLMSHFPVSYWKTQIVADLSTIVWTIAWTLNQWSTGIFSLRLLQEYDSKWWNTQRPAYQINLSVSHLRPFGCSCISKYKCPLQLPMKDSVPVRSWVKKISCRMDVTWFKEMDSQRPPISGRRSPAADLRPPISGHIRPQLL